MLGVVEAYLYDEIGPEFATEAEASSLRPAVIHEGREVRLEFSEGPPRGAVRIPLRNGFPMDRTDRTSGIICLRSETGERVGHVVRIPNFGLAAFFERPCAPGAYRFSVSTPVGRA
ncbi:MAG: hypothetical protein AAF401_04985 [Pseudomonadota bacterium]